MSARRILLCLFITLLGHVVPLQAQDGADVIRGRVLGPDKQPIANVTVTATAMSDQTSRTAKTNKDGRFTIVFDGGGGDYLMSYTAIGLAPNRFEIKREVDEDVLVADATMSAAAVVLDAIRTTGRQRVDPNRPEQEIGGHEQSINMNNVSIDAQGDLAAMAASLPGVSLIPGADGAADGFSVLGLGADQNNVTLNGLDFSGSDLPRDATTQTRVATSTFDPSRGGFSGAQITLRSQRGSNYEQRTLHATVDAPSLQYTDAIGRQLGQQYSNLQISGNASGPIRLEGTIAGKEVALVGDGQAQWIHKEGYNSTYEAHGQLPRWNAWVSQPTPRRGSRICSRRRASRGPQARFPAPGSTRTARCSAA